MKVNDPNLSPLAPGEASRAAGTQTGRIAGQGSSPAAEPTAAPEGDDVHLSELVRSLRALAAESPARQAYVDQIEKTYASGNYQADAEATASKIVDDALGHK
jgi:flagellar biosynthesis anti-sigma factor FlgM